ncbi:hypothetical protein Tco_1048817 [Tanacetum coccineum]
MGLGSAPRMRCQPATASRVIDMEDMVATSNSSGTPAAMEKSPLDFSNEDPTPLITNQDETESHIPAGTSQEVPPARDAITPEFVPKINLEREVTAMGVLVNKGRRKRDMSETEANAPPKLARRDQRIQARDEEIKKLDEEVKSLRVVETEKAAEAKNEDLAGELESLRAQLTELQLYPHMLTAIAGRRWVIVHGLRLAVMKCAESAKLRQGFADVVSAGIAKGMSEGLKHEALKDLKYPLVDQLEQLKDAPMDLIMVSLHLESDTREDAPSFIRDLRPSSSQLKILVYPEVRDPKDPWAVKEEMLLEDVIAANVSRAEKKKKCRIVCRTHGVGFAHHARSDGVPVSVLIVAPQGLQILLKDAAAQTELLEDESSPRFVRSKSLPMIVLCAPWESLCPPNVLGKQIKDAESVAAGVATLLRDRQLLRGPNDNEVRPCMCCGLEVAFLQVEQEIIESFN